ncbi:hypothetical protein ACP70R_043223 [Stipagrostis hirtigluma subsp. patula]
MQEKEQKNCDEICKMVDKDVRDGRIGKRFKGYLVVASNTTGPNAKQIFEDVIVERQKQRWERWEQSLVTSTCTGSKHWELNPVPDGSIEGINPLQVFGPRPVWEWFAVPIRRKGKVMKHLYCTFYKKVFPGDSTAAYDHMIKKQGKICEITKDQKELPWRK